VHTKRLALVQSIKKYFEIKIATDLNRFTIFMHQFKYLKLEPIPVIEACNFPILNRFKEVICTGAHILEIMHRFIHYMHRFKYVKLEFFLVFKALEKLFVIQKLALIISTYFSLFLTSFKTSMCTYIVVSTTH
jgi:hypothetical protein